MTHDFKNAIAITGGIATGKSTVCSILKLHGYPIIDTDLIAHDVLEQSANEVVRIFGDEILDSCESSEDSGKFKGDSHKSKLQINRKQTQINRKKLGKIVFADKEKLRILESILHPKIRECVKIEAQKLESQNIIYFIDIPLFFELQEQGRGYAISRVLLIYAPRDLQLERIQKRDNLSIDEAKTRLSNQMDIESKKQKADFVIENTGNVRDLQTKIEAFLKMIANN